MNKTNIPIAIDFGNIILNLLNITGLLIKLNSRQTKHIN